MRCRDCGKEQEDRKMMGYCECGGKLIDERHYKLEQKTKCKHIIGDGIIKFKYCPLCGNKTKHYKEK